MNKKNDLKKYWKVFFTESLLFFLTAILSIVGAVKELEILKVHNISVNYISVNSFIIQFAVITLFIFLISKAIQKREYKGALFKAFFILAIFSGGTLILSLWLSDWVSLILMFVLLFLWNKNKSVLIHNLVVVLGIAGTVSISALSLQPLTVVVLLVIFSVYDFIAVYKTKHMVKMAKSMIKSGAVLGIIIPHRFSYLKRKTDNVSKGWAFVLGGGDIAFPLLLACSLVPFSVFDAFIVAGFALLGLFFSFLIFIFQRKKRAIPALPPIALMSIIGYLSVLIF